MENIISSHPETTISFQSLCDKIDILKLNLDFISFGRGKKSSCTKLIKEITNRKISMMKDLELIKKLLLEYASLHNELKIHHELINEQIDHLNDICQSVDDSSEYDSVLSGNITSSSEMMIDSCKNSSISYSDFSPAIQYRSDYKAKATPTYLTFEIAPLTDVDYKTLPKYMVGRLTLESINNFVDVVNESLSKKYSLLSKPLHMIKKTELQLYRQFKLQQSGELKARRFVAEEDIARVLKKKNLEKKAHNFLTILRHTRRLTRSVVESKPIYTILD